MFFRTPSSMDCTDMLTEKIFPRMPVISITRSLLFFPVVAMTWRGQPNFCCVSKSASQISRSRGNMPKLVSAICRLETFSSAARGAM